MIQNYLIRRMTEAEVQIAVDWARQEGWNPGLSDGTCFYRADPQGFFLGCLNNEPIATGSAVVYDDHFAFCGLYIVKPEFRAHGYGMELTKERLNYIGKRIVGLDGVLDKTSKYERLGYVAAHSNMRYELLNARLEVSPSPFIVELKTIPFATLEAFDRHYFPAKRTAFLQGWITQPKSHALGYLQDQKLRGYGVLRKCYEGYKIGPLFAESAKIAHALFEELCAHTEEGPVYLDVPAPNQEGQALVKYYEMKPKFEVIRMYRNGMPNIDLRGIYGITTYELG